MKEALVSVDLCMFRVSNLLKNLVSAQYNLRKKKLTDVEKSSVLCAFSDALEGAKNMVKDLESGVEYLRPEREVRPKNLELNHAGLFQFDSCYFDYLNVESPEYDFYEKQGEGQEVLCRHLATWVYDDGDTKAALNDVKKSFGKDVHAIVKDNIKNRRHDT